MFVIRIRTRCPGLIDRGCVLTELLAVDAPGVGLHLAVELDLEGLLRFLVGQLGCVGGAQGGAQDSLSSEFGDSGGGRRNAAGAGLDDGAGGSTGLALGGGLQHEDAVADGDGGVDPFSHGEVDGRRLDRLHGETVGVGDGESVPGQADLEDRVGSGIDEP